MKWFRKTIYLTSKQVKKLEGKAGRKGSESAIIRDLIDKNL